MENKIDNIQVGDVFYYIRKPNIYYTVAKIEDFGFYLVYWDKNNTKVKYIDKDLDAYFFNTNFYSDAVEAMIERAKILINEAKSLEARFFPEGKKPLTNSDKFKNLAKRAICLFAKKH